MNRLHVVLRAAVAALIVAGLSAPALAFNPLDPCAPTWSTQPSPYWVNQDGYERIPFDTLLEIFDAGFDSWTAPCCSSWSAAYQGTSTRVGEDANASQNIFSFRETNWPSQLGDARWTLAVTLTTWRGGRSCSNLTADMVFNSANHTFATNDRQGTDLQSVTTHEQGHWLGLDHTPITSATMYESYIGEAGRTLHADDEDGVCFLYPGSCGCTTTADCDTPGHECVDGFCIDPPCRMDADCDEGLICFAATGDCIVPPCLNDSECAPNEICDDGECILERDCEICAPCEDNPDCGAVGICLTDGVNPGVCTRSCPNGDADCPGDSECFTFTPGDGNEYPLCFNPTADVDPCPDTYACTDVCADVDCPAGQYCNPDTGACIDDGSGGGDTCYVCQSCETDGECGPDGQCLFFEGDTTGICSVNCDGGGACPGDSACFELTFVGGGSTFQCLNPDAGSVGSCPAGYVCDGAPEPPDPCDGVDCPDGQTCDPATGACVGGGGGGGGEQPGDCSVCWDCETDDDCGSGGQCLNLSGTRVCVLDCSLQGCPGNTECFEVPDATGGVRSICLNDDAAEQGVCWNGWACDLSEPVEDVGGEPDAGGGGADTGGNGQTDDDPIVIDEGGGGSGCAAAPGRAPWSLALLGFVAMIAVRRRQR